MSKPAKHPIPTRAEAANIAIIRTESAISEADSEIAALSRKRDDAVSAEIAAADDQERLRARKLAEDHSRHIADLHARREALGLALERAHKELQAAIGHERNDARAIVMAERLQQAERLLVHALEADELIRKLGVELQAFGRLGVTINGDAELREIIPNFVYAMSDALPLISARLGHFRVIPNRATDDPTKPAPSLADRVKGALEPLLSETHR
ncbi:MAG: hypothetical protein KF904_14355 [Rhodoblastus sp.]|nr:hypothetical protein [Rhodoblastus sp.]